MATKQHAARIQRILSETKGKIILGGAVDVEERFVAPTVVKVSWDDVLMDDEIFAPVLPIVVVRDVNESIRLINEKLVVFL